MSEKESGAFNRDKFIKILALASSPHDGEAVVALRLAQNMLATHGLTLADLAAMLDVADAPKRASAHISVSLLKIRELRIAALERENAQLRREVVNAGEVVERWKQMALDTTRDAGRLQAAAEKWRELARRTADNLWELGRQLHALDETPENTGSDAAIVRFPAGRR